MIPNKYTFHHHLFCFPVLSPSRCGGCGGDNPFAVVLLGLMVFLAVCLIVLGMLVLFWLVLVNVMLAGRGSFAHWLFCLFWASPNPLVYHPLSHENCHLVVYLIFRHTHKSIQAGKWTDDPDWLSYPSYVLLGQKKQLFGGKWSLGICMLVDSYLVSFVIRCYDMI